MSDVHAICASKTNMLAPPNGLNFFNQTGELFQIFFVNSIGASERKIQAVRNQSEIFGEQIQFRELFRRRVEIMIGGDFEKINFRSVQKSFPAINFAETHSDT